MGCCILGALIIGRWLYALRRMRQSWAGIRLAMPGLLLLAEIALIAGLAGHDMTGASHMHAQMSSAAASDAICTHENPAP